MPELIRYATLAASGHNAQPRQFAIRPNAVEIHPDLTRRLPVVDPDDRELWISLGCALENLVIAARTAGCAAEIIYPDDADFIGVRLVADRPSAGPLYDAIPLRQNTRSAYDGRPIAGSVHARLQALPLEPGIALHFAPDPAGMKVVSDSVAQANLIQYAGKAFLKELPFWLRFNKREALASFDGLYAKCSGHPAVPRCLGRMILTGATPQTQAEADAAILASSPGAIVIASNAEGKSAWVRTGRVYERMALAMTSLTIKSAFLNQPIEVAEIRSQFQTRWVSEMPAPNC